MRKLSKFAIIGKGFIYPRHKKAIEDLGQTVALTCDIDPAKEADFIDWVEMFNHPRFREIEFVSICTPNYLHSIMTREAILKGKKVLCEKPFVINSFQAEELPKRAFTVLQLRHHPEVIALKESGVKPKTAKMVVCVKRDQSYWKGWKGNVVKSGGIVFNLGLS